MPKRGRLPTSLYETCASGGVHLRTPQWADYDEWVNLRRTNKAFLQPWEPSWKETHLSRQSYKAQMQRFSKMIAADEAYPFHVFSGKSSNDLVGACNLTQIRRGSLQSAHIGYWIGNEYLRQGYAKASIRAVLKFGFEDLGLHRIIAAVHPDNQASINLLAGLGFVHEGIARGYLKVDGRWSDHLIFAKLVTD